MTLISMKTRDMKGRLERQKNDSSFMTNGQEIDACKGFSFLSDSFLSPLKPVENKQAINRKKKQANGTITCLETYSVNV